MSSKPEGEKRKATAPISPPPTKRSVSSGTTSKSKHKPLEYVLITDLLRECDFYFFYPNLAKTERPNIMVRTKR